MRGRGAACQSPPSMLLSPQDARRTLLSPPVHWPGSPTLPRPHRNDLYRPHAPPLSGRPSRRPHNASFISGTANAAPSRACRGERGGRERESRGIYEGQAVMHLTLASGVALAGFLTGKVTTTTTTTTMSIAGKYVLSSNDKYSDWLGALGIPADSIAKLEAAKPQLEVSQNGNEVVVKTVAGDKNFTNSIVLGQDSKASLPGGIEYTVNLTLSGNNLTGTWNLAGKSGSASVEFTASGITQKMSFNNVTATRTYTRQ